MNDQIRTWTLDVCLGCNKAETRPGGSNCDSDEWDENVRVIELDPVLDLLVRHLPMDGKPRCAVDRETVALLRQHGRLQ